MNDVFMISGPDSDLDAGEVVPRGVFRMPIFDCNACGTDGLDTGSWYASLRPQEGREWRSSGVPERVDSYDEYDSIRRSVQGLFNTAARLLPGSIVGAMPMNVPDRGHVGQLTEKKLRQQIDFVSAGYHTIVSSRVAELLTRLAVRAKLSPVVFRTKKRDYTGYRAIEIEPQLAWSEEERDKWQLTLCDWCGTSSKKKSGGTFKMKQFQAEVFREGYVLVMSAESSALFINAALRDELEAMKPSGVSFRRAGYWAT